MGLLENMCCYIDKNSAGTSFRIEVGGFVVVVFWGRSVVCLFVLIENPVNTLGRNRWKMRLVEKFLKIVHYFHDMKNKHMIVWVLWRDTGELDTKASIPK